MAEEEHFATLQLVAMPWSLLQVVIGYVDDRRTAGHSRHKTSFSHSFAEIIRASILPGKMTERK
jgi:hypothetical protein